MIESKPDVTVHAATSRLKEVYTHVMECVEAGSQHALAGGFNRNLAWNRARFNHQT
ncbi:MAG: hypothetical protein QXO32_06735 [Candidatus Bathyarchaeia archaeon]